MFTSKVFWHALLVSVQYVGLAVGVEMLLGFGLALLMNRALWGRSLFRIVILLPLMLPPATGALMWALTSRSQPGLDQLRPEADRHPGTGLAVRLGHRALFGGGH